MRNPLFSVLRNFGAFVRRLNNSKSPISTRRSRVKTESPLPEHLCRQFSLDEIRAATNDFDSNLVIGEGGSGVVYQGIFDDDHGAIVVAVKRFKLEWPGHRLEEFRNEVQLLCQLRHQHLVSLIGFCDEKDELIVVYQHMSNGSLYDYLHGTGHEPLAWKQRLEICIGAARGLHHLHTGAKRAVIHRDIKSKNILMDDQRISKLCDFGFSKIGPFSTSNAPLRIELPSMSELVTTTFIGTYGYLDPEFLINSTILTDKSDVHSFGVVLFEVLCGRKVIKYDAEDSQKFLIRWVCECMRNGTIYQTIDPYLKGKIAPSSLQKFLEIAFSCIHIQGTKRPALGEVEATLELALELQNQADSEMECINPHGEGMYEEVLFSVSSLKFSVCYPKIFRPYYESSGEGSFKTEDEISILEWRASV